MSAWPPGVSAMSPLALAAAANNYNLAEPINAETFGVGAVGDAVQASSSSVWTGTDNSARLSALITAAAAAKRPLYLPPGNYLCNSAILPSANISDLLVYGDGEQSKIIMRVTNADFIAVLGTTDSIAPTAIYLTADAAAGSRTLTVNDTSTMTVDQWIVIKDNAQNVTDHDAGDNNPVAILGEVNRVQSIDSATQITLYGYTEFAYTSNVTPGAATVIRRFTSPARNIVFRDLAFEWDPTLTYVTTSRVFSIQRCVGFQAQRIKFANQLSQSFSINDVIRFDIDYTADKAPGNLYHITVSNASSRGRVRFRLDGGRHGITSTTSTNTIEPSHILVYDSIVEHSNLAAYDQHPGARDWVFANCQAIGGGDNIVDPQHGLGAGFQLRGRRSLVTGGHVSGYYYGVSFAFGDHNRVIGTDLNGCKYGVHYSLASNCEVDVKVRNPITNALLIADMTSGAGPALAGLKVKMDVEGNPSGVVAALTTGPIGTDWEINITAPDATNGRWSGGLADKMTPRFPTGDLPARVSTDGTDTTPVVTETYIAEVLITETVIVNGLSFFNGSAISGNIKGYLADYTGTVVASTASTAQAGIDSYQRVALTSVYLAKPGKYYVCLQVDNTTARFNTHTFGDFGAAKKTSTVYGTLASITAPTTFTANLGPIATVY